MKKYIFLLSFLLLCRGIYAENYISGYEYWMDNDYTGKTFISTTGNQSTLSINEAIDVAVLPDGLHWFHIRFLDSESRWGTVQSKSFLKGFINQYWESGNNKLAAYEYWLDDDYDNSILVDITPASQFTLTESLDFSSLPEGLHWFHIRFKDTEGNWGPAQSKSFLIQDISTPWVNENNVLEEYEYWLDNDYANKQGGTINSVKTFTLAAQIDYTVLTEGLHHFHIRFRDKEGKWSTAQSKLFYIPDLLEYWKKPDNKIIAYSYWFDNDNAASINVTLPEPVNPYSLVAKIDVPAFEANTTHTFSIKFKDTEDMWSPVHSSEFTINSKPLADAGPEEINIMLSETINFTGIASDIDGDPITQYEWAVVSAPLSSIINGILSASVSFSFTPDVIGDFILSFRAFSGTVWSDPDYVTVHVISNTPPIALCKDVTVLTGSSSCTASASIDDGSYDPDGDEIKITQVPPGPYSVGTTEVTLTVTDINGESASCSGSVTVLDNVPPSVVTQDITVYLNETGSVAVTTAQIDNGSSDNCGYVTLSLDITEFNCSDVGENNVILSVTDDNGNSATGTAVVTVMDNIPPVIVVNQVELELVNGTATLTIEMVDNGSYDNCGIETKTLSKYQFDCSMTGEQEVNYTVTDIHDNTSEASVSVVVIGEEPTASITVDPEYTVTGEEPHTIYLGYSTQSVTLTANTSGGNEFEYQWTSNLSGYIGSTQSITVTPTQTTTYTVSVTNEYGCTDEATVTIVVYDWRCGKNLRKIKVCHNGKTICIDDNAVDEHLSHGDYLGDCRQSREFEAEETIAGESFSDELAVRLKQNSPNPFSEMTEIQYFVNKNEKVTLNLVDVKGRIVANLIDKYVPGGWNSLIVNGSGLTNGVYFLHLESNGKTAMMAITKY